MTTPSPEKTNQTPVTADLLAYRYLMLSESLDPRKTTEIIADINDMLARITPDEASSIFSELYRQKTEIETQTANATAEPISSLQDIVDTNFEQNIQQIESSESHLEAARVLAQTLQPQLLQVQDTLLQQTIGQSGSQRRENLTHINEAMGAVALKMVLAKE